MGDQKKRRTAAIIIHSFAVAHATTAALLANTVIGDAPVLTVLTISMIYRLAKLFDLGSTYKEATSIAATLLGWAAGVYLASRLIVWIPWAGNMINASITFGLTETLGWTAFFLFEQGLDPTSASKEEILAARKRVKTDRIDISKDIENLVPEAKVEYERLQKKLGETGLSKNERESIVDQLIEILDKKYSEDT